MIYRNKQIRTGLEIGRVRNTLNKHTHFVSSHHTRGRPSTVLFSHRQVKCPPSSAHQVPCAMFTEQTVLLLLLNALRDSLSIAQACHLFQEELRSSSSQSPSVCPRAGAVTHHSRPGLWLLPAVPRARDGHDSSQHCFGKPLGELQPM